MKKPNIPNTPQDAQNVPAPRNGPVSAIRTDSVKRLLTQLHDDVKLLGELLNSYVDETPSSRSTPQMQQAMDAFNRVHAALDINLLLLEIQS